MKRLITDLTSPDPARRRHAAESLAGSDERALYPLIRALRDEHPGVQDAAMRSITAIGGEVAAYMMVPLLRDEPFIRNTAMIVLRELGAVSVPLLYPLLKDKDDDVRKFAVDLLIDIRESVSPAMIEPALGDPNANVRASAAKAMGALSHREAIPLLIGMLRDDEWVCFSVLEALGVLQDESTVASVAELLKGPSPALRLAAVEALGKIATPGSVGELEGYLAVAGGFERTTVIRSLLQIGTVPSVAGIADELMEMFRNGEWDERMTVLRGLTALRDPRVLHLLIDTGGSLDPSEPESDERLGALKAAVAGFGCADELISILHDPSVRYRGKTLAIEVIGELRCREALPSLIQHLRDNVRDVRRACIRAIGALGDDAEARDVLVASLEDHDSHVRKTALAELGRLGNGASFEAIIGLLDREPYQDVIEEAVKALCAIDAPRLSARLDTLTVRVRDSFDWIAKAL